MKYSAKSKPEVNIEEPTGGWIRGAALGASLAVLVACGGPAAPSKTVAKPATIGMLPKFTSDPYFAAANQGAQEAAKELGIAVEFNGPVDANVAAQSDIIDRWVRRRVNAIAVSANDPNALAPAMKRAAAAGIKVMTWDADVAPDARQVFLSQATFAGMGKTMVDMMVRTAGTSRGDFLIVTAVPTAPNQNRWIEEIRKYAADNYPDMKIAAVLAGDEDLEKSKNVALNYLQANPTTKGVFCVTGIATPGVIEAVKQLGLVGKVAVTGLGVPSLIKPYLKDGSLKEAALWNPVDIGYAAIYIADAQLKKTLDPKSGSVSAGRLGRLKFLREDTVLLGEPLIFTRDNIDQYSF
jgi:rhamnose transport system substrate-binding protein